MANGSLWRWDAELYMASGCFQRIKLLLVTKSCSQLRKSPGPWRATGDTLSRTAACFLSSSLQSYSGLSFPLGFSHTEVPQNGERDKEDVGGGNQEISK